MHFFLVSSTRIRSASVSKKCVVLSVGVVAVVVVFACQLQLGPSAPTGMAQTFRNLEFLDKQPYGDFSFFAVQNRLRNVNKILASHSQLLAFADHLS